MKKFLKKNIFSQIQPKYDFCPFPTHMEHFRPILEFLNIFCTLWAIVRCWVGKQHQQQLTLKLIRVETQVSTSFSTLKFNHLP